MSGEKQYERENTVRERGHAEREHEGERGAGDAEGQRADNGTRTPDEKKLRGDGQRLHPKIYVASLSDYNEGRLHGVWIDAAQDADAIHGEITAMLAASRSLSAEEWAIHDFEDFGSVRLSEWESMETVSQLGLGIAEHGAAFAHWAEIVGTNDHAELQRFEESYLGRWDSLEAYAQQVFDDLGLEQQLDDVVPTGLRPYVRIDYEMFGRDVASELHVVQDEAQVHIFQTS